MSFVDSIDTILLGGVTYEMFAGYWPNVTSGDDKPFADKLNAIPKVVFSKTREHAPWGKWDDARIVKNSASGKPLFRDKIQSLGLKLLNSRSVDRGTVLLAYTAAKAKAAAEKR